jgi:hypothetical protein
VRKPIAIELSIYLYLLACAVPALVFSDSYEPQRPPICWVGVQALIFGMLSLQTWQFAPLANISYLVSLVALGKFGGRKTAHYASALACLVALDTFALYFHTIPYFSPFWLGSNCAKMALKYPGIGFYFWIGSMLVIFFASGPDRKKNQSGQK